MPLEGLQMEAGKRPDESHSPKRAERVKLTPEESLKRMREFNKRKERLVAAVRRFRRGCGNSTPGAES